ncbi:hypothetical protein [Segetibacter koreensis]|uniref:hypothetical protein n=1 Tax=Segetibacter koreensis TaxID=398037 RepID=UPI00036251A1|nr:hypothetical protein [Segetibacter koreensis]
MKKNNFFALITITALFACNGEANKKVLIMGRGSITANGNDVTMKEGSGYAEETVEVNGDKPVTWNVTTPTGKNTINIPADKGFYILNLRADTIVGSQQILGTDISNSRTITQEELKKKIDSLTKLTTGANITPGSHNYMILPNQSKKISDNTGARVFGPFTKIPGTLEADKSGKAPEIYKFYTNSEMRELIANFKKMTY